ncbi:MAG TPA: carbohydrate ABC transporter permease [Solirubrobacteraceae bacterium]|nr:carbohydrate ABC transporter permease [Solirubrobacteraceae bacterium]
MTRQRPNYAAGAFALLWLLIVIAPVYVLVKASFQTQEAYTLSGPLSIPKSLTTSNFSLVAHSGFLRYLVTTGIVTAAVVLIVVLLVPPVAFAIVRNRSRAVTLVFRIFLLGLAVPISAVLVPMYYLMTKAHLYDTLIAVILPTAAFSLPLSTLILTGAMRDITNELYEAMALDGASSWRTFRNLVIPLSRGGLATIIVFSALQAWNGFLFPLILTQGQSDRVFTLGLFDFQTSNGIDAPAICAAVVLSIIPILLVYLFARRWLIRGLMGVGGK